MDAKKSRLLDVLRTFIGQRSGLDYRNYSDARSYRAEQRSITRDRHHAETLLRTVEWRDSITADSIIEASKHAFSGRLTIKDISAHYDDGSIYWNFSIDYCTGQYFPTEYRRAVAAVMASALWDYWRANIPPGCAAQSKGDYLRNLARKEFGRTIANRWFQ